MDRYGNSNGEKDMDGDRASKIPYTRAYATVDLDAVVYNMEMMKANLAEGTTLMAVVKTDGYGHGAAPVAWAVDPYVEMYAAASAEEALNLKKHGIKKPILILGPVHDSHYKKLIEEEVRVPVFTWEQAEGLSRQAVSVGKDAYIHLVTDTGMSRIGMKPDEESADLAVRISRLPGIFVEGLFTHFARADEEDKASTYRQVERYNNFVEMLEERGLPIPVKHISNSAGIIDLPKLSAGFMVRAGISMYGLYPSGQVKKENVSLKPAMELKSFITYIKEIGPGDEVSYGGTFVAKESMRAATVSIGYGDGYPRSQSGKGRVLIHGKSAPVLGRVCMDQMIVDVSHIPEAEVWDTVTLVGTDGEQHISVEELAETGGGFHYEIVCDIGKRVPRIYIKDGKITGTKDYFQDVYEDFVR